MKRVLSVILTMMLVFALGTSIVTADEWVETLVAQFEANGSTVEEISSQLAGLGLSLNTETMQITDGEGKVLTEDEFYTALYGGSSSGSTSSQDLSDEDYASAGEIFVFDVKDNGEIKYVHYITGTDALIEYYMKSASSSGEEYEDTTYNDKRALKLQEGTSKPGELANVCGVGCVVKKASLPTNIILSRLPEI